MVKPCKWLKVRQTRKGRDDLFRERVASGSGFRGSRPARSQEPEPDENVPAAYPRTPEELRTDTAFYGWDSPWHNTNSSYDIRFYNYRSYYNTNTSSITDWVSTFQREHYWQQQRAHRLISMDPPVYGVWRDELDGPRVRNAIRQLDERMRGNIARREASLEQRRTAQVKAESLLLRMLDEQQRAMYDRDKCFIVISQHGRRYVIHRGRQHNIFLLPSIEMLTVFKELRTNTKILELCVHLRDYVPDEDNILAQKLWLETNEDEFLRMANVWDWSAVGGGRPLVSHEGEAFNLGRTSHIAQRALQRQHTETESGLIVTTAA